MYVLSDRLNWSALTTSPAFGQNLPTSVLSENLRNYANSRSDSSNKKPPPTPHSRGPRHAKNPGYLRSSLLRAKLNDKSVFDSPIWRHGGGPLMCFARTGSLDTEKKENSRKAVARNFSTDNTTKSWPAANTARLVHLLTNHAPTE